MIAEELSQVFRRDLTRLQQEIQAFPDDAMLWQTSGGVANSAGNLALHLEGNLREFVGRQLGGVAYTRQRDLEFSSKGVTGAELAARIEALRESIPGIIARLTPEQLDAIHPQNVLGVQLTTRQFVIHILSHFNYHLGQIDCLRRVVTGAGAIQLTNSLTAK